MDALELSCQDMTHIKATLHIMSGYSNGSAAPLPACNKQSALRSMLPGSVLNTMALMLISSYIFDACIQLLRHLRKLIIARLSHTSELHLSGI